MDLKNELLLIEKKNDWEGAIQLLDNGNDHELDIHLRVMFLLIDFLVEGQNTKKEQDYAAIKLIEFFEKSTRKFQKKAEFLFFTGIMAYMGEWYFGMDSVDPAAAMLKGAMDIDSNNTLYKWGYYSRIDQRLEENTDLKIQLSEKLMFKENSRIDFLKRKGLLGKYVLGTLQGSYEDLVKFKTSI